MQKTVLIPTDFTIESLNLFKYVVQTAEDDCHVVFVHCLSPSESMIDLLFVGNDTLIGRMAGRDFKEACAILRNRSDAHRITDTIELFKGKTISAFQNFLDGFGIDEIVAPLSYRFQRPSNRSIDPVPFIRESQRPVIEVDWPDSSSLPEKNQLAELFNIG